MKRRYRVRLRAQASATNWIGYGRPYLSEETLLQALGEATIHRLITTNPDSPEMDVELAADSREQAVSTMLTALASLGFDAGHIVIVDLVKAAIQRALFAAGGFGALGATTKNPWVILVSAGLGAAIGVIADVAVNEAWAMIVAERVGYTNEWRFTEVPT
jgi:hypothetical protein